MDPLTLEGVNFKMILIFIIVEKSKLCISVTILVSI